MKCRASKRCPGYFREAFGGIAAGKMKPREDLTGYQISEGANLSSKRQSILIVDPDSVSRSSLEESVRSAGYDVAVSSSQAAGFKFVQEASIDLLILSADLADIQCCDALAEIKGNSATAGTRVMLLTQGGGGERARGLDLGADEVLTSPWDAAELLARVRVQLRAKHAFDALQDKTRISDQR